MTDCVISEQYNLRINILLTEYFHNYLLLTVKTLTCGIFSVKYRLNFILRGKYLFYVDATASFSGDIYIYVRMSLLDNYTKRSLLTLSRLSAPCLRESIMLIIHRLCVSGARWGCERERAGEKDLLFYICNVCK